MFPLNLLCAAVWDFWGLGIVRRVMNPAIRSLFIQLKNT